MYSVQITNSDWRIDSDGFLRITARVLKAGVYDYAAAKMPPDLQTRFAGKGTVRERIDAGEFSPEALASLEGKPVVAEHSWRKPSNTLTDGLTIGSVAGKPRVDGDGILVDLLVSDPDAIKAVQDGELREVSAAYDSNLDPAGDAGGGYDCTQRNLRFNHVLLCPAGRGRCGPDVRILNEKGDPMPVQVKIGDVTYQFTNEADAAEARKMADSEKAECKNAAEVKVKNAAEEVAGHLAKLKKAEEDLVAAKDALAQFMSEEYAESAATERENCKTAVANLMDGVEGKDKEILTAAVAGCKTLAERVKAVTVHVLNSRGVDASAFGDAEIAVAFKTLAATVKAASKGGERMMPEVKPLRSQITNAGDAPKSWRD